MTTDQTADVQAIKLVLNVLLAALATRSDTNDIVEMTKRVALNVVAEVDTSQASDSDATTRLAAVRQSVELLFSSTMIAVGKT